MVEEEGRRAASAAPLTTVRRRPATASGKAPPAIGSPDRSAMRTLTGQVEQLTYQVQHSRIS
jgi:hypothetical protein